MPIFATVVALNYRARTMRRLAARVAKDSITLAIFCFDEVGSFVIARPISITFVSYLYMELARIGCCLPCSAVDRLNESAIPVCHNAFEVISNVLWECEISWIAFLETAEKRCKQPVLRLLRGLCCDRALRHTNVAIPRLVQFTCVLVEGRIETGKVK